MSGKGHSRTHCFPCMLVSALRQFSIVWPSFGRHRLAHGRMEQYFKNMWSEVGKRFGRLRPSYGRFRSNLRAVGKSSTDFERFRLKLAQVRPNSCDFSRSCSQLSQSLAMCDLERTRSDCSRYWTEDHQALEMSADFAPTCAECRPSSAKRWRIRPHLMQISAIFRRE